MFDLAISMIKSTDIYIESQTPKNIEEDQKGGGNYVKR